MLAPPVPVDIDVTVLSLARETGTSRQKIACIASMLGVRIRLSARRWILDVADAQKIRDAIARESGASPCKPTPRGSR
jgi:hypothetical protein